MKNNYAFTKFNEKCARALGRDLNISTKHSVEISRALRGMAVNNAVRFLENVIQQKEAVPFKRFVGDVGHRKGVGMASGRYPVKASQQILKVVNSAVANANNSGLNVDGLMIRHICAHKASRPMHYGRQSRREMKRTHIEVVVEEVEAKKESLKKAPQNPKLSRAVQKKQVSKEAPVEGSNITEKKDEPAENKAEEMFAAEKKDGLALEKTNADEKPKVQAEKAELIKKQSKVKPAENKAEKKADPDKESQSIQPEEVLQ